MDEKGYVYLLDRKKDMIISGGMNVYSSEVENVIQKRPEVRQSPLLVFRIRIGEKLSQPLLSLKKLQ